ncbi:hypothetical protein C8Q75DRAFT_420238 [Abortiporus biennis]|nr:hypothetical protein C8Q75DRAFT_420238 [Abortiporus biennis]
MKLDNGRWMLFKFGTGVVLTLWPLRIFGYPAFPHADTSFLVKVLLQNIVKLSFHLKTQVLNIRYLPIYRYNTLRSLSLSE